MVQHYVKPFIPFFQLPSSPDSIFSPVLSHQCRASHPSGACVACLRVSVHACGRVAFQYLHTAEQLTLTAQGEAVPASQWGSRSCKSCSNCQLLWLKKKKRANLSPHETGQNFCSVNIRGFFFLIGELILKRDSLTSHRLPVSTQSEPTEMSFQAG